MFSRDNNQTRDQMTIAEKNRILFLKQKEMLDEFLKHGAISQEQYDLGLKAISEKMR